MARVTIKGLDEAREALRRLANRAPQVVLAPAVKAGLDVLESAVLQRVPVKTGALKATVHCEVQPIRNDVVRGAVVVGDESHPYVASDEYGNHHQEGQRFLTRAWDAAHEAAQRAATAKAQSGFGRLI